MRGEGGIECHHGARRGLAATRFASGTCAGTAVRAGGKTAASGCQVDTFAAMALAARWLQSVHGKLWEAILVFARVAGPAWQPLGPILGQSRAI